MKKILFLSSLFLTSSCVNMEYCNTTEWKKQEAQSMYNAFGTSIVEMDATRSQKLFGGCYRRGDEVYVYNTLWNKKFVLARYGKAVTYVEDDGLGTQATGNKYQNYNRGVPANGALPGQSGKTFNWF